MHTSILSAWSTWLPHLLDGLLISLKVTGLSLLFGLSAGLALALLVSSRSRLLKWPFILIVEVGRGMPALVMLQLVYFGLPSVGVTLDTLPATVLALSVTTAAYTSEIMRAGLRAVPAGELEAADALGLSRLDANRYVVIPQGLRIALPALMGFAILVLQISTLAFSLGLPELLGQAYSIGASTFRYFDVLLLAGVLYLAITIPASWLVGLLESRLSRHR